MLRKLICWLQNLTTNPDGPLYKKPTPNTIKGAYTDFCVKCWVSIDSETLTESRCPECNGNIEFVGTVFRRLDPFRFPAEKERQEREEQKQEVPLILADPSAGVINFASYMTEFRESSKREKNGGRS